MNGAFTCVKTRTAARAMRDGRPCPQVEMKESRRGEPMTTDSSEELPYATVKSLRVLGKIRDQPQDFQVEEVPAYAPEGRGEHLFVRFRKTDLNTPDAVRRIAEALGVDAREAGWAGLKDRRAVTVQWASFHRGDAAAALALDLPGIEVLDALGHPHKIRTGHLRSNRFLIRIRGAREHLATAGQVLERLALHGAPNYYGEQRFGHDRNNLARARAWLLEQGPPPRDRFQRKLLASTLQSEIFNQWLAARVREGAFERPVPGDLMRKEDSGGLFVAHDLAEATERMQRWEISPTGPMMGAKMRWPEADAERIERVLCERWGLDEERLSRLRTLLPGTRRVARVRPADVQLDAYSEGIEVAFTLPKGAYATVILRELMKPDAQALA
jgi:tRNA pseudouridine13 synthase